MNPSSSILKCLLPALCLGGLAVSRISAPAQDASTDMVSEVPAPTETAELTVSEVPDAANATASSPPSAASVLDEKVIPQAFDEGRYQTTWNSNPFLRKTVVVAGPRVDWSQDWALAGMYKSTTGKIIISMQNKQTSEFKKVTSDDGADSEFRLVKANFNRNRTEASAEIAKGSETATLKYDDNLTSKPVTINNTLRPAGGAPGQPGAPGSPAVRPGQPANATAPGGARPGMPQQPGMPVANPNAIQPGPAGGPTAAPAPPTISRRRQLIPAPVPQPAQQ